MKKNMIKRALTVSLASLMAISSALPVNMLTASAVAQSGSCGEDIYWAFNPNGELTIYGSGVMDNFAQHKAPWKYTYTFERAVKKVTILDGVTNISCNAFSNLPNLTTVTIPDSVEIIKDKYTEQSKGFGFVEMTDDAEAQKAISALNGTDFESRRIRVNFAQEMPPRNNARNFLKKR
jgi:RNA recognition motif-containing protein